MSEFIKPINLIGKHVYLEPLQKEHVPDLIDASTDGELWKLWYTSVPTPEKMQSYVDDALMLRENSHEMPFVVREVINGSPGQIVGSTRMLQVEPSNRRLEIGYTWYAKRVQRTAINTECKLLMLSHVFEQLECIAVEFRTHWMNYQSREAISRLGAKQDGILRNHRIMRNGTFRDTVVFSIIESEWPTIKQHLTHRLTMPR